jgi:DNA-binding MarR family transcriptional regulator
VVAKTRWLNAREARAWRQFLLMQARLQGQLARQLQQESGLSAADYEVLVNLSESPEGRLRPFELLVATQWEKSRLSHHITRMAERGLVDKENCDTDRRGAWVTLTDEGRAAIEAAAPSHVADVRRLFVDPLTPDQLDALAEISEAVLSRIVAEEGCEPPSGDD